MGGDSQPSVLRESGKHAGTKFKAEKEVVRQREANEVFTIDTLNKVNFFFSLLVALLVLKNEVHEKWLNIHYEMGTFQEAKEKAMKEGKALYLSIMVDGPEPEVTCLVSGVCSSSFN